MSGKFMESASKKEFTSSNTELDRRIGSIKIPSIVLVEGPNDSGKSVLSQQYVYGALQNGLRVYYVTTESGYRQLIKSMEDISFDVKYYFLNGDLKIAELHVKELEWKRDLAKKFLDLIINLIKNNPTFNVFVIDSLTYIATYASEEDILSFFTDARNIVEEEFKTIIITVHTHAFNQEMMLRIRSICDVHFLLSIKEIGDRMVRILQAPKIKGAIKSTSVILSFEVDPAFGIKVLPFSQTRA
ncbi:MAG: ATPase domain-containing protein [Nitrososphaerota archaeon]|nr:flagellar accessory protein FlaH [Aigarchaeota archaeon]MDW8076862.1 ATPase domain-containing protein [Nitrososphaerota archaeon]